jgi:hypothetical protein
VSFVPAFSAGSHLGEGATFTAEFSINGTEYYGHPTPLTSLTVHLPAGVGGSSAGFPTCPLSVLQNREPEKCPKGSLAGPLGKVTMWMAFGSQFVEEQATLQAYFGSNEEIYFWLEGVSPAAIEILMSATYLPDSSPYGRALTFEIPLIETVPGAPYASITALTLGLGASYDKGGTETYSVTIPQECPTGNFAWAADATFNGESSKPVGTTETACPSASSKSGTTTTVKVSNASPVIGETVTYTAIVTPNSLGVNVPSGTVTFTDNGTLIPGCLAQPLTQGIASSTATCSETYSEVDPHSVAGKYKGDPNFLYSESLAIAVNVQEAAKGGGTTGGGSMTTMTSPPPPPPPPPVGSTTVGSVNVGGSTVSELLSCVGASSATCELTLSLTVTETLKGGKLVAVSAKKKTLLRILKRTVTVGSMAITLTGGKSQVVKLALNATGRRLLTSHHKLAAQFTTTDVTGGHSTVLTRHYVTFKVPARHKHKSKG